MDSTRPGMPGDAKQPDRQPENQPPTNGQASGANGAQQPENGVPNGGINLMTELIAAQKKADEYLEGMRRERAEFVNYRKRVERESEETYQRATVDALKKILPVVDDFDRAIANMPAGKSDEDVIKGFLIIHRKMLSLLEGSGIKVINPVGEVFNPAFHEALGQDDVDGVPSGHITAVLQKGYTFNDKLIRPALVRIAR